jgi:tetratricopeptide (TPR) repeat protein
MYQRALEAEAQQQWEVAEAGYNLVKEADPQFAPAYERLAELRLRRGNTPEAVGILAELVAKAPSVRAYALLSRAYAVFAMAAAADGAEEEVKKAEEPARKGGLLGAVLRKKEKKEEPKLEPGVYGIPKDGKEAVVLARRAADEAVKLDPSSAEAQLALGFALVAADRDGKNKGDAMAAFGKAALLQPKDAANQYGLGFGIRTFGAMLKDASARKSELERAVAVLKEALVLRPTYYEAHRELAFCYHLMDNLPAARQHYELANANRGAASDEDEVAAVNLSLASIHKQEAAGATGEKRQGKLAASDGYVADAKETRPNLARALRILNRNRLGSRLADFLPAEMRDLLNPLGAVKREIDAKIPIPGGFR